LSEPDVRLQSFVDQIADEAKTLGYGRILVEFTVRDGLATEAHITGTHRKLSPAPRASRYTSQ
jgi:hypothetical protein